MSLPAKQQRWHSFTFDTVFIFFFQKYLSRKDQINEMSEVLFLNK